LNFDAAAAEENAKAAAQKWIKKNLAKKIPFLNFKFSVAQKKEVDEKKDLEEHLKTETAPETKNGITAETQRFFAEKQQTEIVQNFEREIQRAEKIDEIKTAAEIDFVFGENGDDGIVGVFQKLFDDFYATEKELKEKVDFLEKKILFPQCSA